MEPLQWEFGEKNPTVLVIALGRPWNQRLSQGKISATQHSKPSSWTGDKIKTWGSSFSVGRVTLKQHELPSRGGTGPVPHGLPGCPGTRCGSIGKLPVLLYSRDPAPWGWTNGGHRKGTQVTKFIAVSSKPTPTEKTIDSGEHDSSLH